MRISRLGAAAVVTLLAAACGGSSGPSFATSIDATTDTIFAANSLALFDNTLRVVFDSTAPGTPSPFFARGVGTGPATAATRALAILGRFSTVADLGEGRAPAPEPAAAVGRARPPASAMTCVPTETGVDSLDHPIDSDGDGVPDDYTVNFGNACSTLVSGLVYTFSGSFRIQDTGTGLMSFAFTATKLTATLTDGSTGDHLTHILNGTESASFAAALASHAMDFTLVHGSVIHDTTGSITFTMHETSTYTVDPGSAFAPNTALPAGQMQYSADFRINGLSQPGNFRFLLNTESAIHYAPACASGITAGNLTGLVSGSSSKGFSFNWDKCGPPTVSYFGTT